jgi:CheY-like chemotaxis protein
MDAKFPVLIAEDDLNDQFLIRRAIMKTDAKVTMHIVSDGEEALDYLSGKGKYADRQAYPFPSCVITDIKMPRRSGFDVLEWLFLHPECKVIPVMVLSSSTRSDDVLKAYQLGANAYFAKPSDFENMVKLFQLIVEFWRAALRPEVSSCN